MTYRCEGGTHHAACDCREAAHAAEVARLRDDRDTLARELDAMRSRLVIAGGE